MVLSRLASRLRNWVRDRIPRPSRPTIPRPSRPSLRVPDIDRPEIPVDTPAVDVVPGIEERNGDTLSLGLTVVALTGIGLTTIGVVGRLLVDRLRSRGDDTEEPAADTDHAIEDVGTAGEPPVGTSTEPELADEREPAVDTAGETSDAPEPATVATEQSTALGTDEPAASEESAGVPRIAPLVGMVALIGIRLFIERFDGEYPVGQKRS